VTGHYTHGSESIWIEGEGLISTQVGGRTGNDPDPVTESESPKATAAQALPADQAPPFRFSRVGPKGTPLSPAIIKKLARAMTVEGGGDGKIPAGFTYLGQFIDHDLTMDKTSVMLGDDISPVDMIQGRSPRLDLDSLYGNGPDDAGSAKFYEADALRLKAGTTIATPPDKAAHGHDLPRVGKGTKAQKKVALIPDPRNDENLIVAQTHTAMIRFHNRVVQRVSGAPSVPANRKFIRARKLVTLHYQWVIRHDYLPRICDDAVLDDVWANGRKLVEPNPAPDSVPTMPVEFSVAAFRLGHSMVRPTYNWNKNFFASFGSLFYMFEFSALGGNLGGEIRLISSWIADWRRMYDFKAGGRPNLKPKSRINKARRIDTLLTDVLAQLPAPVFGGDENQIPFDDLRRNLAFRNLTRASMVKLATGQQMVAKLKNLGVNVKGLTKTQILTGNGGVSLDKLTTAEKNQLAQRTPLWFYILREAEVNDGRLHGVGARIVAETFHRAMEGSQFSIVRDPSFKPSLGRDNGKFEMTDLLFFAFGGQAKEINPLGGD
jgi:hypothetical protein